MRHQREHLPFAVGEPSQRICVPGPGEQLHHHFRVEHGAPIEHFAQRLDEVGDVGHPVLEQVPDPDRPVRDQLGGVLLFDVLAEHHDRDLRKLFAHDQGGRSSTESSASTTRGGPTPAACSECQPAVVIRHPPDAVVPSAQEVRR